MITTTSRDFEGAIRAVKLHNELKRNPFRPLRPSDLPLFENREGISFHEGQIPVLLSRADYRKLYANTLVFTHSSHGLIVTFMETAFTTPLRGFGSCPNGGIILAKRFLAHRYALRRLFREGLAKILFDDCRKIEKEAGNNDPTYLQILWHLGKRLAKDSKVEELKRRFPEEWRFVLAESFNYRHGFATYNSAPIDSMTTAHTHIIMDGIDSCRMPSRPNDFHSQVIWMVIDIEFIRHVLSRSDLPDKSKIRQIFTHHLDGMKDAECIGAVELSVDSGIAAIARFGSF